jgi:hypothetical protein
MFGIAYILEEGQVAYLWVFIKMLQVKYVISGERCVNFHLHRKWIALSDHLSLFMELLKMLRKEGYLQSCFAYATMIPCLVL